MGQSKESIITDKGETTILNVQCALDTLALIFDKAGDVALIRFDGGAFAGSGIHSENTCDGFI